MLIKINDMTLANLNDPKLDLCGKRVLIRVNFDLFNIQGKTQADYRMRAALPSIRYVL